MDVFGQPVRGRREPCRPFPRAGTSFILKTGIGCWQPARQSDLPVRPFPCGECIYRVRQCGQFRGEYQLHRQRGDSRGCSGGIQRQSKGRYYGYGNRGGRRLSAGGDILLHKGMRGMRTGVLEAEGDITAKFLEDCNIFSRNNIQAEYIINSEVSCGHD